MKPEDRQLGLIVTRSGELVRRMDQRLDLVNRLLSEISAKPSVSALDTEKQITSVMDKEKSETTPTTSEAQTLTQQKQNREAFARALLEGPGGLSGLKEARRSLSYTRTDASAPPPPKQ